MAIRISNLKYAIKYMLYRMCSYDWVIMSQGGNPIHPRLGDLRYKKKMIEKAMPDFRNRFLYNQDKIYMDTDQVLYDEYENKGVSKKKMSKKQRKAEQKKIME